MIKFIMKCIEKDPNERYGWDELFNHELFSGLNENATGEMLESEGTGFEDKKGQVSK